MTDVAPHLSQDDPGPIPYLCLGCRAFIQPDSPNLWVCPRCGRSYRALLGIPDLRTFAPPYLSLEQDWSHAEALARRFAELSFAELVRYKYEALYPTYSPSRRERDIADRLKRYDLAQQRVRIVSDIVRLSGHQWPAGALLDVGCGTGPFLAAVATKATRLAGIDISMEELILARKRLDEAGATHVQLAAACAEQLPFPDCTFAVSHGMDVIEHVKDPVLTVREVLRVTTPDGLVSLNSPNRLDLREPEPHVNVRFVGFWPRRLQEPYVKLVSGQEYKEKHLLSLPELVRLVERSLDNERTGVIVYWHLLDPAGPGRSRASRLVRTVPGVVPVINKTWGLFAHQHEILICAGGSSTLDKRTSVIAAAYGVPA